MSGRISAYYHSRGQPRIDRWPSIAPTKARSPFMTVPTELSWFIPARMINAVTSGLSERWMRRKKNSEGVLKTLEKTTFYCRVDAQTAAEKAVKDRTNYHTLAVTVEERPPTAFSKTIRSSTACFSKNTLSALRRSA